jgi:hypothetical protein
LLRAALINIGSVLTAKSTVETEPASTATLVMQEKLRAQALAHVGSDTHLRQRVRWGISRTTSAAGSDFASVTWSLQPLQLRQSPCNCCRVASGSPRERPQHPLPKAAAAIEVSPLPADDL